MATSVSVTRRGVVGDMQYRVLSVGVTADETEIPLTAAEIGLAQIISVVPAATDGGNWTAYIDDELIGFTETAESAVGIFVFGL